MNLIIDSRLDMATEGPLADLTDKQLGFMVRTAMSKIAIGRAREFSTDLPGMGEVIVGDVSLEERPHGWELIIEDPLEEAD